MPLKNSIHHLLIDKSSKAYFIMFLLSILAIATKYFVPQLIGNETVYLIEPKQFLDNSFLFYDWTNGGEFTLSLSFLYSAIISPFWLLSSDYHHVALMIRVSLWFAFTFSTFTLCKQLEIPPFFTFIGLLFYIFITQSIASFEWVIGGGEQKVLSYSFIILALSMLLKNKFISTGIFSGLAIASHILVGGYCFIALFIILSLKLIKNTITPSDLSRFLISASIVSIPSAILAFNYFLPSSPSTLSTVAGFSTTAIDIDKHSVLFRNPHHLDPFTFYSTFKIITTLIVLAGLGLVFSQEKNNAGYQTIKNFLSVLFSIFVIGIIARFFELYAILKFYPFRVADTLLPLFFLLLLPHHLLKQPFTMNKTIKQTINIVYSLLFTLMGIATLILIFFHASSTINTWKNIKPTSKDETVNWVKNNTANEDVFLCNPFWEDFWISAERAMVINFKSAPTDYKIIEWSDRLKKLNADKDFEGQGFTIEKTLTKNFQSLSYTQLKEIHQLYGAKYYVVKKHRADLKQYLHYKNNDYFIYNISTGRYNPKQEKVY